MKKILLVSAVVAMVFGGTVGAVSEELTGAIKMHCADIATQLGTVRYYDLKAREYLGNRYERLVGGYVTNLNVRLVRSNMANAQLQALQGELVSVQGSFKNEYTTYAAGLNDLIKTGCAVQPSEFYAKLEAVRVQRAKVRGWVETINSKLDEYRQVVVGVRAGL